MPKSFALIEKQVARLEKELARSKAKLAKLRRKLPPLEAREYVFQNEGPNGVPLSSLFGDKQDLIVVHNMGRKCPYCAMWADGFNGLRAHLESRAAFALVSPDGPKDLGAFARERGWTFRVLSAEGTSFIKDMGFERKGLALPGVSTFYKDKNGRMFRIAKAAFGPGDNFCPAWDLFDLLSSGSRGWGPKLAY